MVGSLVSVVNVGVFLVQVVGDLVLFELEVSEV